MDEAADRSERLGSLEAEVHVWLQRTNGPCDPDRTDASRELLDADETARCRRLLREGDRRTFLAAHALLRRALSWYTDVAPGDWSFTAERWGRPEISGPALAPPLRFSLSHTTGLIACAVGLACECGVDVEASARRGDPLRVAPRVLAASELADLQAQPASARRERFLAYWTLKEAYLKALGVGLTLPLRGLVFALNGPGVRLEHSEHGPAATTLSWQFASLRPTADHVLALAVGLTGGPPRTVRVREGPPGAE
jgi:4'-phosphopantetheinyl transferase